MVAAKATPALSASMSAASSATLTNLLISCSPSFLASSYLFRDRALSAVSP
jgi:hypothetical protein